MTCDGREIDTYPFLNLYDPDADYTVIIDDSNPINTKTKRIKITKIFGGWNSGDMPIINNSPGDKIILTATNSSTVPKNLITLDPNTEHAQFLSFSGAFGTDITSSTDSLNALGISFIKADTSAANIDIGGIINGVSGQILTIFKTGGGPGTLTIKNNKITANQEIITSTNADKAFTVLESIQLCCFGLFWREVGN